MLYRHLPFIILKKDKDFERSMGQKVEVKLYAPECPDGYKKASKEFEGQLSGYDGEKIKIVDDSENELVFSKSAVALIRLAVEF